MGMMLYCDRCGKANIQSSDMYRIRLFTPTKFKEYDICKECHDEIKKSFDWKPKYIMDCEEE